MATLPLPPGSRGIPLLGHTLSFVKDPFASIERELERHGTTVFRTHVFFRPTAVIAGPDAATLWLDESLITRVDAAPPHIVELFGGENLAVMDGERHHARKALMMRAFEADALASYLPTLDAMVGRWLDRLAGVPEFRAVDECKKLAMEAICTCVLGIGPGPELDELSADYRLILHGLLSVPIPLPGTAYTRARAALARILKRFTALIERRIAEPSDDGLSRLIAARGPAGERIAPEVLRVELHHVIVAGFIILGYLAATLLQLAEHPEIRVRVVEEVRSTAPSGAITVQQLARKLPFLTATVDEIKRCTPIVPMSFGRARTDCEFQGYRIPAGWSVFRAVTAGNFMGAYADARTFDPQRFLPPREEQGAHPHAFTPQGVGTFLDHKCPGLEFSTLLMQLLTVHLARSYTWELPQQDLGYRWGLVPPEPRDGLRVRLHRSA